MRSAVLLLALAACGNAELVAPEPLVVLDTSPGNGSVVASGERPLAIVFSEPVVADQIQGAVRLEETTEQGSPIRGLALSLDTYDDETNTAVLRTDPLAPDTFFALTVTAAELRAVSGARMRSDLVRRFRTGP